MGFLRRLWSRTKAPRVVVIGLDGTPCSLVQRMLDAGTMPNMAALVREGVLMPMTSVHPWVSSVAWSTIATGVNPGRHNIYGFIDRDPATMKTFIPTARRRKAPTLWRILSDAGKRVIVMNVPVTYPPEPVNGLLVAGFLAPNLDKATYPETFGQRLAAMGYRIDTDPQLARRSRDAMLADVRDALDRRLRAILDLMDNEPWDFFMAVVMETDRLHHFFFGLMEQDHPTYAPAFFEVYRKIDRFLGEVRDRLDDGTSLLILSDHGFCSVRKAFYVNRFLAEKGWLKYRREPPDTKQGLAEIHPETQAYALDPGRIFINLQGREREGSVAPGPAYEALREAIAQALVEELRDPETGEPMVQAVYRREELYEGPYLDGAADLILAPINGYDPKGALYKPYLTHNDETMVGMHTYDDAMLYLRVPHRVTGVEQARLQDIAPTVLQLMKVERSIPLDGRSLLDR